MSKTARNLSIGGAITAAIASGIMAIFTPTVVMWGIIIVGLGLLGWFLSWGVTQAYKILFLPKTPWRDELTPEEAAAGVTETPSDINKRKTYIMAMSTGGIFTGLGGVVYTLIGNGTDTRVHLVIAVLWFMYSLLIAVSSPFAWRWTFELIVPRLKIAVGRHGVKIVRDEETGKIVGYKDVGEDHTTFTNGRNKTKKR